jgi:hypothetical protein
MRRTVVALTAAFAFACGGSQQEAKGPEPEPEAPKQPDRPKLAVTQELGSIDPGEVQKTWNRLTSSFDACRKQGTDRVEYLAGDVKFFVRVGADGATKWTYLEDSTLGDRDTERCLLDAVTQAKWPKPDGGDAEVRNSFGFDATGRAPTSWSSDKIAALLGKNDKDLLKCKGGLKDAVHVTVYVEPHGHKEGKVQAAGASVPQKDAETKIDCILNEVKSWKMPSPGSWAAKVDFRI